MLVTPPLHYGSISLYKSVVSVYQYFWVGLQVMPRVQSFFLADLLVCFGSVSCCITQPLLNFRSWTAAPTETSPVKYLAILLNSLFSYCKASRPWGSKAAPKMFQSWVEVLVCAARVLSHILSYLEHFPKRVVVHIIFWPGTCSVTLMMDK